MTNIIREARLDDKDELRGIWNSVFGDTNEEIDRFFDSYFEKCVTIVSETKESLSAAGYLIPAGSIAMHDICVPCGMIYSVATLPEHRGQGLGAKIVRELITTGYETGFEAIVLCPSDDLLFGFYSARTDLQEYFYVEETLYKHEDILMPADSIELAVVDADEYVDLREVILADTPHIKFDHRAISYQKSLCKHSGGGLLRLDSHGGMACAITETQPGGELRINELLVSGLQPEEALKAISKEYPAPVYLTRTPARLPMDSAKTRRFGMLVSRSPELLTGVSHTAPFYGLAFD